MSIDDPDLLNAINGYLPARTEPEPADLGFVFGTRHGVEFRPKGAV